MNSNMSEGVCDREADRFFYRLGCVMTIVLIAITVYLALTKQIDGPGLAVAIAIVCYSIFTTSLNS